MERLASPTVVATWRLVLLWSTVVLAIGDLLSRAVASFDQPPAGTGLMLWRSFPYDVLMVLVLIGAWRARRGSARMLAGVAAALLLWSGAALQQLDRRPDLSPEREWFSFVVSAGLLAAALTVRRLKDRS